MVIIRVVSAKRAPKEPLGGGGLKAGCGYVVPNFNVAKNVIRVLRRGGGSGPGIDLHQKGIESVVFQLFLRGVILLYFGRFWMCLLQCFTSFLDTRVLTRAQS